ncbi:hypothetical protein CC2G_008520 [Coprinopsis cinerea AmutBmut pab1-1]|nr:hypothetical protein CC2G_008520 [Coprinopsis cinerea AmutBmut pab1-1]
MFGAMQAPSAHAFVHRTFFLRRQLTAFPVAQRGSASISKTVAEKDLVPEETVLNQHSPTTLSSSCIWTGSY